MQVRTIQEAEGPETVCVVFSSGAASWDGKTIKADALKKEMLARCKIFVEAMEHEASNFFRLKIALPLFAATCS